MKKNEWFRMVTIGLLIFFIVTINTDQCASEPKTIMLVGSKNTKESFHGRWLFLIYTEVFRRLGYQLDYQGYPAKRASSMSDRGEADGEIHRVYDYSDAHPELIRVEEPHFSIYFSAYAVNPGIRLQGWESLKNTVYHVEYRRGVKKCETELSRLVSDDKLTNISSVLQGLKKLKAGRTDVFIDVERIVEDTLLYRALANSGIYKIGVMEEITVHTFLNKRHYRLVPQISKILKTMKEERLIEKYRRIAKNK